MVTDSLVGLHAPIASWLIEQLHGNPQPRILDYGFGSGAFLIQMARQGAEVFGCDLSTQNVRQFERARERHGIQARVLDLSVCDLSELGTRAFDLITLFQVVEHLVQPLARLRQLSHYQCSGGLIYIECPNDDATLAWAKRFTRFTEGRKVIWRSLRSPEHLHGFNKYSLPAMLRAAGYELLAMSDYYYRDGIHQVEAEKWWPRFSDNQHRWSPYGATRSVMPVLDAAFSRMFGAGSGLWALARKNET